MKYLLLERTLLSDGTTPQAVWTKESFKDAIMQLHQTLASAMANANVVSCLCMVITEEGEVLRKEYYNTRPYPTSEVEED